MLEKLFNDYNNIVIKEGKKTDGITKEQIDELFSSEYFQGRLSSFIQDKAPRLQKNSLNTEFKAELIDLLSEIEQEKKKLPK
jgi:hypothetical protein